MKPNERVRVVPDYAPGLTGVECFCRGDWQIVATEACIEDAEGIAATIRVTIEESVAESRVAEMKGSSDDE